MTHKHKSPWRGSKKFDSKFEKDLQEGVLSFAEYHPSVINYEVHKTCKYTPDFVFQDADKIIYVEAKGRFRTSEEANKYLHVRTALDEKHEELVFVFMNGKTPMPNAKRRKKCGTKNCMSEWAEKNDFRWFTKETFAEEFKDVS